ncbi:MAG: hypothetical protein J2P52_12850, partial [Blastocatellia bacterium]|nr:hypothetical protein [Blastocatellia bacterium]
RMVKLLFWLLVLLIPLALWAGVAATLRRKLQEIYQWHFADARRERLFLSAVSFFIAFTTARAIAYAVHREAIAFRGVFVGETHVHHLVFGILILLLVGWLWLIQVGTGSKGTSRRWSRLTAIFYGVGSALTLDEFALWFNLADVYWARAGRESLDAVILFFTALSVSLWGGRFFLAIVREIRARIRHLFQAFHRRRQTP